MVEKVRKRDGSVVDFDPNKREQAIWKAAISVGGKDREKAAEIAKKVVKQIKKKFDGKTPSVEDVQDIVEKVLIEAGHAATAKAYILYRHRKGVQREMKNILGVKDDLKLSMNSVQVLQRVSYSFCTRSAFPALNALSRENAASITFLQDSSLAESRKESRAAFTLPASFPSMAERILESMGP